MNLLILTGILSASIAFGVGYHSANNRCAAHELAATVAAKEKYDALESRYNEASANLEGVLAGRRSQAAATTQAITKIVDRPVYRRDCLDADGVRLANDALTQRTPRTGKPASEVPAVDTTR